MARSRRTRLIDFFKALSKQDRLQEPGAFRIRGIFLKKFFSIFLRISITVVLLIFLFSKVPLGSLAEVWKRADWRAMAGSFAIFFFLNIMVVLRWSVLLRGQSLRPPLWRLFLSYSLSVFCNLFFPSTIGGDAVRTLDISRHTKAHSSGILATVLLDRICGFLGLVSILFIALVLGIHIFRDAAIFISAFVLLAILIVILVVLFSVRTFELFLKIVPFEKIKDYLKKLHAAAFVYRHQKRVFFNAWLISLVIQGGLAVVYWTVARALGIEIGLFLWFITVPIITAASVIPLSIGGLGVRDTACVVLLAKIGLTAQQALAVSLTNFVFILVLGLAGGICYVPVLFRRRI